MLDNSVAITFVKALLDVAETQEVSTEIEKDLDLVCEVFTEHEDLKKIISHPSITRDEKKKIIKNVFGKSTSELMNSFLNLLVDRRKEMILDFIPLVYKKVIDEKKGVLKAKVQTAIPLIGDRLKNLTVRLNKLTGKTVEVEVTRNPQILGGVVVEIGNIMIDGSVASRLKNLRTKLMEL
ncbi:MAG: ATP synthase F1 subunit delta [Candidatus Brocadiaceae bacterium]|nr:ATP synthase F1 subunit delta [Candidatus Brocadiaceae bacterium]